MQKHPFIYPLHKRKRGGRTVDARIIFRRDTDGCSVLRRCRRYRLHNWFLGRRQLRRHRPFRIPRFRTALYKKRYHSKHQARCNSHYSFSKFDYSYPHSSSMTDCHNNQLKMNYCRANPLLTCFPNYI
ncbi:hypothetical protein DSY3989 [Desulfitobacterium hafniense Y51]|uniref:Uncharacterized protein n=1 Tax=Desulfitobacterium hafniense (strain Y51) TaxID=138119 RepID=Q24QB4_DESHY|nr:hypothetical protein DSY3989 [Desulfitobacterium hafniense Y51]